MSTSFEDFFLQNPILSTKVVQKKLMQVLQDEVGLPNEEIRQMTLILMEEFLQIDKIKLLTDSTLPKISSKKINQLKNALERLSKNEPIQYITEQAVFRDLSLKVNEAVLIPRPETEELVELIITKHTGQGFENIIDLGTGSACIAIALARHFKNAKVWAIDLSEKALEVATHNVLKYQAEVKLMKADLLQLPSDGLPTFSLIVSNPPYVTLAEKKQMRPNVLDYEPKEALFINDDAPLQYYEAIAKFAKKHLQKGGSLWVEINAQYGKAIVELFQKYAFHEVRLYQDLQQKDRFVSACLA